MATTPKRVGNLRVNVTDTPDPGATAVIADGLAGYNEEKGGLRDHRPLAILVSDPETDEVIGGLYGRSYLGVLFIERFFLPEDRRGNKLGSRILAMRKKRAGAAVAAWWRSSRCTSRRRASTASKATISSPGSKPRRPARPAS